MDPIRSFIENLFSAVSLDNFGASFSAALSENLTWTVTGSSPIAGIYHPKEMYISQVSTYSFLASLFKIFRFWYLSELF